MRNAAGVPLEGTLTARLEWAGPAGQQTRPLGLAAGAQATVNVTVPPLPAELREGRLVLTTDNGYGSQVTARLPNRSSLKLWMGLSLASYEAGEAGELGLTLRNQGTLVEEGQVTGSIEGVGVLPAASYSVLSGVQTSLRFPFTVPLDVRGGLHRGTVTLPPGTSLSFSVPVAPPRLVFVVEDRLYPTGQAIPVTIRNTESSGTPQVKLTFADLPALTAAPALEAGARTTLQISLPAYLPSGSYALDMSALDRVDAVWAARTAMLRSQVPQPRSPWRRITSCTHSDRRSGGCAGDEWRGGARGGQPALEITTPCGPATPGATYHFETWDGARWVERAWRHRNSVFETDLVDLAAYLPDPDGEYKVEIRQTQTSYAYLDYAALVSGGA